MKNCKLMPVALLMLLASCGGSNEATDATGSSTAQETATSGQTIFRNNCIQCHAINQDKNGPKLAGSIERWNNDTAKLMAYIRNSQEVIKTDAYAAKLYANWSNMVMPAFPNLTDAEIKQLIDYIAEGKD